CIEARIVPFEHLGEFNRPMKRHEPRVKLTSLFEPGSATLCVATQNRACQLRSFGLPFFRLLCREKGRDYQISDESHLGELELGLVPEIVPLLVRHILIGLSDLSA